ncbi:MAG: D-alanyl-D-alanine carboxypeptidase, partial [Pseudomonadota bacterium]
DRMTRRAREIGMMNSVFANSTGWPHPEQVMSAEDLVTLATHLINQYPEYYPYFAETTFVWEGIEQDNRNPLLALDVGADGLKTGHTQEAGYGLVGSAERDGRRVTFMLTGLESTRSRLVESERLVNWAFREFYTRTLFEENAPVSTADVWIGAEDTVDLVAAEDINIIVPFAEREKVAVQVVYSGPVAAPISRGQEIAELVVTVPEVGAKRIPLVAGADVAAGGFLSRFTASARILTGRLLVSAGEMIN